MAAQIQVNWQPRVLGPMSLRPGSEYLGGIYKNQPAKIIPFVASFSDTAIVELTNQVLRAWVNDAVVTRKAVATVIPPFSSWTTTVNGTATAVTTAGLTFAEINQGALATATVAVTCASADQQTEHAARLVVQNGPIVFKIGSTSGADDIFGAETLDTGVYSMAFTPGVGTFYIQFASTVSPENFNTISQTQTQALQSVTVTSIAIEGAGVMTVPTPWPGTAYQAPSTIRYTPSADVIFIACPGVPQYQINRYSPTSWSVVLYKPVKGPMNATVGNAAVKLTPSTVSGNGTLNANQPQFSVGDVGTLFRLFHNSQNISQTLSFDSTYTDCIRVTGVSTTSIISGGGVVDSACTDRDFTYEITGTWSGKITLERSYESPTSGFTAYKTFTMNETVTSVTDGLDNEIIWYRLGFAPGDYVSGDAVGTLAYPGGGGSGVCHVTGFVNSQQVDIEILVPFYNDTVASDWHQSEWSGAQGYPTSTAIHEGRLWWAGADRWWGSTSDDYTNFDFDAVGDASYIDISVGQGPIANMNWLMSLDNLLAGADTSIITARSDAIQSPLTPTNFNLRFSTTTGSTGVQAVKIDNRAIYVDQSTRKVFVATYDLYSYNYKAEELSNLNPDIGFLGYVGMAIQRNPDTRILLIRADGQIVSLVYDEQDEVKAFWRMQTAGSYEDIIVLPGVSEDRVYTIVNRGGVRMLERFARIDECTGGLICKLADSHMVYSGDPIQTISAPWLAGKTIVAWGDGVDLGPITLDSGGNGNLPMSVQNICFGLGYSSGFLSTKLAYAAQGGTAINQKKRVDHIGFVLQDTHYQGIKFGSMHLKPTVNAGAQGGSFDPDFNPDFSTAAGANALWDQTSPLQDMPLVERGVTVPVNTVWTYYDEVQMEFPGDTDTDARIYIQASAPRPATVVGVTIGIQTSN